MARRSRTKGGEREDWSEYAPRGPKYDLSKIPEPKPLVLSKQDAKALARMVRKYGRDAISEASRTVPLPRRGRPPRGEFPYYERMHLADWIDETADEYRQAGEPNPVELAEIDLWEMLYLHRDERPDFEKWRLTTKKKRLVGRRELRAAREEAERLNARVRPRGGRE